MLKVALLSSWHVHAHEYANDFEKRTDVKLITVWDEEIEKGQAFAKDLNLPFEPDLDKVLNNPEVDAVCISAPTNMHHEIMIKAANAGKHIFTEKILALTTQECEEIKAAIIKNNVKFCISMFHRTFPRNLFAKQIVDNGTLGKITYLRIRNAHDGASANWLPPHFYNKTQCGGGAMIDLGAHPMYLIPWLVGLPAKVTSVFTHVTGQEVEDNAVTTMAYENGLIAISETGFVSSNSPFILEIHGTQGSLMIVDNNIQLVTPNLPGHESFKAPDTLPAPLPSAINQFVDSILHGKEIIFGIDDAITLTKMMELAYAAQI